MSVKITNMDALTALADMPDSSVHCVVTSPPYFGLRDYGHDGQIGIEPTPQEYVTILVAVFREIKRVLREDGSVWLNLGDSYSRIPETNVPQTKNTPCAYPTHSKVRSKTSFLPPKNLLGIPWRVAFALQDDDGTGSFYGD